MQTLELKVPPPIVALLFGVTMWAVARLLPAVDFTGQWRPMLASVCVGFGVIVAILGVWAFRQAKTTVNRLLLKKRRPSSLVEFTATHEIRCTSD